MEELEEISQDRDLRRIAELKDKYIRDQKNGHIGWFEEGKLNKQIEIVKELLKTNMPIEKISQVTKLEKEKIIELKKK